MRAATLRQFCTDKFIKDHIYAHEDSGPGAAKRANVKAHQRDVSTSTMIYIDETYLKNLWGEALGRNRDGTYAAKSGEIFETTDSYMFMENTDRARAKKKGPGKFRYGVQFDPTAKLYKVHHFDGIV